MDHPTQKPLSISQRIVAHFSNPGDVVLVPFAGSGSECLAAAMTGRHFVGYELNEKYIAIAEERIRQWRRGPNQLTLVPQARPPHLG